MSQHAWSTDRKTILRNTVKVNYFNQDDSYTFNVCFKSTVLIKYGLCLKIGHHQLQMRTKTLKLAPEKTWNKLTLRVSKCYDVSFIVISFHTNTSSYRGIQSERVKYRQENLHQLFNDNTFENTGICLFPQVALLLHLPILMSFCILLL